MKKFLLLIAGAFIAASSPLVASNDVNSYLIGSYMSVDDASAKLKENGFDVVTTYKIGKKSTGTTIIFTNSMLKKAASKKTRGFAAVLRVLIDEERDIVSVMNPIYFQKAFLQDDYNPATAQKILGAIKNTFGELKGSEDKLDGDDISGYHFMMSMPYYEDGIVVGEGSAVELLEKATTYKKGKNLIFDMKISDSSYLLGYNLGRKTSKFVKKIGTQNAQVLPYMVLIEDNKATILHAKYYLAISYPLLSMGQFMTIATVPGAIETDLKKPFK